MEKIGFYIPFNNIALIVLFTVFMSVANSKYDTIVVVAFLLFSAAMLIAPRSTSHFIYGIDVHTGWKQFALYFVGSVLILQQNTYQVFHGLAVVGYRAIEMLVVSIRSLG
ncbi:hypothetical protein INR77_06740 [Erythrobacter sp. SCSIO 43205]|uniref:hypothetical protein n=1 Tax=Erythrobacter sp. SCSIO 43205 TaxID=2779361 RepID=UPI001CA83119|nr:hypothetical protein [Erythrobacter sp. SCSIO 43205]UAB79369.1 hypothetical protein INR77_06740 [Erythrobacter sp. SCSIO 43205]